MQKMQFISSPYCVSLDIYFVFLDSMILLTCEVESILNQWQEQQAMKSNSEQDRFPRTL